MAQENRFPRLVALACHDLRNPLATVYGFARTLMRTDMDERSARYVEMIDAASHELGELLDERPGVVEPNALHNGVLARRAPLAVEGGDAASPARQRTWTAIGLTWRVG